MPIDIDLLSRICEAPGAPGYEKEIRKLVLEEVKDLADEIIVFDSGSTDATLDIVRQYTDKIWETDWPGYGPQKQSAADMATHDWILLLDADEMLTEGAITEITQLRAKGPGPVEVT